MQGRDKFDNIIHQVLVYENLKDLVLLFSGTQGEEKSSRVFV